jgi:OmcA/MtrC family decaheme c-type cytochrome
VEGDTPRRQIINTNSCAGCHEIFEGHGGNRVIAAGSENVCVVCHTPNLSSSGRELDLDNPEATNNLRDLIHGIHAAGVRETPYTFVRNFRNNGRLYDWSTVRFPGIISDCTSCHMEGTYGIPLSLNSLPVTDITTDGVAAAPEDIAVARDIMPNGTDLVISPTSASCAMCHDGIYAQAHMEANGGVFHWTRTEYEESAPLEACATCHDSGSAADVDVVHGIE